MPVPQSDLTVHISGAFHKIRAPLVGVSILVEQAGKPTPRQAEVSWGIKSGHVSTKWRPVEGGRYDPETSEYVEERIEGWLVRLDSVDEQSAGGDPTAITVSFKPAL